MMWDSPKAGSAIALRAIWSSTVTYGRPEQRPTTGSGIDDGSRLAG